MAVGRRSRAVSVLVAIRDLFFSSKIDAAAAAAGVPPPARAKRGEDLVEQVRASRPSRLLVDLAPEGVVAAVRAIKSDAEIGATEIVGYCRHTELALIREARAAGCDRVLTQGELAAQLSAILAGDVLPV
jgi:hypothetical protein